MIKIRKFLLTLVLALLILSPISAFALEANGFSGKDNYTWYGTTADNVTVSWDAPEGYQTGDIFEIQIKNPERNSTVNIPQTTAMTKTFKCPKAGHWVVYIRTKRLVNSVWQYSEWADSTDPLVAKVNNQPRSWWLFVWVAGPGPISENQTGNLLSFYDRFPGGK